VGEVEREVGAGVYVGCVYICANSSCESLMLRYCVCECVYVCVCECGGGCGGWGAFVIHSSSQVVSKRCCVMACVYYICMCVCGGGGIRFFAWSVPLVSN